MGEPCDLPGCPGTVVTHVQVVEGDDLTHVAVCSQHAEWLRTYADQNDHVTFLDEGRAG